MSEYNFWIKVKYGYTENLSELEFNSVLTLCTTILDSQFNEDMMVEMFREFLKEVEREIENSTHHKLV